MTQYVPDNLDQLPDEPEQTEHDCYVSYTLPVIVEIRVNGTDEEDAKKEALRQLKQTDFKSLITDYDKSEAEFIQVEWI